jgi:hypothetical protein
MATGIVYEKALNDYIETGIAEPYYIKDTFKHKNNIISNQSDTIKELHQFLIDR